MTKPATVMVSGCFDMLHSGHIAFLEEAATFGRLIVALGSDKTVAHLKGRPPVCDEAERLYHLQALRCVSEAFISSGSGDLDFEADLRARRPTHFVVNDDGDRLRKRKLCEELGVQYHVLRRAPQPGLPPRSSSWLRETLGFPYRIDLAGGWLDQPSVSKIHPGAVVVASIVANEPLEMRSGLASSTRDTALKIWCGRIPPGPAIECARQLFACENPPGTAYVSGSQDALGILLPGISRLHYHGDYWPAQIERITDPETLRWLESKLFLKWLGPRPDGIDLRNDAAVEPTKVAELASAADACWEAIQRHDMPKLSRSIESTFTAQTALFPRMTNRVVAEEIAQVKSAGAAAKLAGAGGLGYLIIVADHRLPGSFPVRIRRPELDSL